MRKAEREAKRARILEVIRKNPDITTRQLAERFRVTQSYITSICREKGIKLEQRDLLEHDQVKRFREPRDPTWGYWGVER
jgi:DNA-binding MarR family transcriptional regulator